MTRCHWEDQCVNFVSLWDPLLWHLAQLWRLENVFNILMMFPGTCGKHPETFVHNDGETKDLAPSFLTKRVLLGGYVLHFHKTFLFLKKIKRKIKTNFFHDPHKNQSKLSQNMSSTFKMLDEQANKRLKRLGKQTNKQTKTVSRKLQQ